MRIDDLTKEFLNWQFIATIDDVYLVWFSEQFSCFQRVISISRGLLHNQRLSEDKLHSLCTINTIVKVLH